MISIVLHFKTITDRHFKNILSSNILIMNEILRTFGIKIKIEDEEEVVIFTTTEIHLIIEITIKTNVVSMVNRKIDFNKDFR